MMIHSVENSGFSITQSLHEINCWDTKSAKIDLFAILGAVNLVNLVTFSLQKVQKFIKVQIQSLKMC